MEEIEKLANRRAKQKKQALWQIWVPLGAGILIVLLLCVMTILLTTRDISGDFNTKWASVSVVFLSIPALFTAFIFFIILAGLIFLTSKLLYLVPVYGQIVLSYFEIARDTVQKWSDKAAIPMISLKSNWTAFTTLFKKHNN